MSLIYKPDVPQHPLTAIFLAPGHIRPELWRTLVGLAIVISVYIGLVGLVSVAVGLLTNFDISGLEQGEFEVGASPNAVLLLLTTFVGMWIGVLIALRVMHKRSLGSAIGRPARVVHDFVAGAMILTVLGGMLALALTRMMPPLVLAIEPSLWLSLLLPAALLIFLQTGAEEVLFRGYLLQQLGARFGHRWPALLFPSLLFGLLHYQPSEDASGVLIVVATALFGLAAADLTWRSGSLGMAWGLHFANNMIALLAISYTPGLDGLSLWRFSEPAPHLLVPLILCDMMITLALWGTCRLWLRRRGQAI